MQSQHVEKIETLRILAATALRRKNHEKRIKQRQIIFLVWWMKGIHSRKILFRFIVSMLSLLYAGPSLLCRFS